IELLDRQGHQGEVGPVTRLSARKSLNKGCLNFLVLKETALIGWNRIDHAENVRLWKNVQDLLQDALRPAIQGQPIVDDGNLPGRRLTHLIFTTSLRS